MKTIQAISKNIFLPNKLLLGSSVRTGLLWRNLITEKRISRNWLYKLYKGTVLHDFWLLLSSPVN